MSSLKKMIISGHILKLLLLILIICSCNAKKLAEKNMPEIDLSYEGYLLRELQGTWILTEDSLANIIIKDGNWTFNYENEFARKEDSFKIVITDSLPENIDIIPDTRYLILMNSYDTLNYEHLEFIDSIFSMTFLPNGKIHTYRRKK